MSNGKTTIHYELLRGILHLPSGSILSKSGSTDDAETIKEIEKMAEIKTAAGRPQYILIRKSGDGEVNSGLVKAQGDAPPEFPFKYPDDAQVNNVRQTLKSLTDGGLDFQTANALSGDDIKAKTKNIGDERVALVRAIGKLNDYPEFQPAAPV